MFADTNATHNYSSATSNGFGTAPNDHIYLEKFTGLPIGQKISKFYLNQTANGGLNQFYRIKFYQDDGAWQYDKYNGSHTAGMSGNVWAEKFTGLPSGATIKGLALKIQGGTCSNTRVKIYKDDGVGGDPSTLLGESGNYTNNGVGVNNINVTATVPASGNVWGAFEYTGNLCEFVYSPGQPVGSIKESAAHVYGSGPSPFGPVTNSNLAIWMILSYQDTTGGFPQTLLNQTNPIKITTNGIIPFNLSTTIPASGNVWVGFETNSTGTLSYNILPYGNSYISTCCPHVFGSGPNPFLVPANSTYNQWMRITYGQGSGPGSANVTSFKLSGAIFGNVAQFDRPLLKISSPSNANVTELGLFNDTQLLQDHIFNPAIYVPPNTETTLPWKFNDTRTGLQNYKVEAAIQTNPGTSIAISNTVQIYFGNLSSGNLNINQTNPLSVSFKFVRNDTNSTTSKLDVYYPNTFNSTCKLYFQSAQVNKTYFNLPTSHATFQIDGYKNDVIDVNCIDQNSNATGNYVFTQVNYPLLQQIKDFRAGKMGTSGMFGAFDLVTLIAMILSIIGFNRLNESVGAVFNVGLIGALAYLGIIQWPVILSSSIALVLVLVIPSTRKIQGL